MDRFSISVPSAQDTDAGVLEFNQQDVPAMLSRLEHDAALSGTPVYCNGRQGVRLLRLGQQNASYWMIVPA